MNLLLLLLNSVLAEALPTSDNALTHYQNDEKMEDDYTGTDYGPEDISEEILVNSDLPNFVTQGGVLYGREGGRVELPCQVNHLGGRDMIWEKENGLTVPDQLYIVDKKMVDDDAVQLERLTGGEGTLLIISSLRQKHSGNYTCRIADKTVKRSLAFNLNIILEKSSPKHSQLNSRGLSLSLPLANSCSLLLLVGISKTLAF